LPSTKKTRGDLRKTVDADYYGYRDEDDGSLLAYEEKMEEIAMGRTLQSGQGKEKAEEGWVPLGDVKDIPTQNEVEEWLVDRRKKRLMEQYGI
jgi:pre-mRNA-splicing factor ISY1